MHIWGKSAESSPSHRPLPAHQPGTEYLMTMLKALLLAGTVALASPFAIFTQAWAQETVTVAGIETTRIVIAPPKTELARIIKAGLSAA